MTELSAEARALIERVGGADGPDAERRIRVKRHLVVALASAGAGLGGMTQVATAAVHAGATGVVSATKLTAGTVAIWLATGAAVGTLVASPAVVWRLHGAARATPSHDGATAQLPPSRPPVSTALPAVAPPVEAPAASAPERAQAPAEAAAPTVAPSLADETRLLELAQLELAAGRPSAALSLLDEHSRRFTRGALAQERSFARILSLCALDRTGDARRAASAFLAAWPSSPLVPRLQASCGLSQTGGEPPLSR